ncbi:leucine ABC transporter subunit substrate-binding protein LivK, partial [Burkholderia sp. MR1-5-21]
MTLSRLTSISVAAVLFAAGAATAQAETVKIAIAGPMSG